MDVPSSLLRKSAITQRYALKHFGKLFILISLFILGEFNEGGSYFVAVDKSFREIETC